MKTQTRGSLPLGCMPIAAYLIFTCVALSVSVVLPGCVQRLPVNPSPGPDGGDGGQIVQPVEPAPAPVTIEAAAELGIRLYAEKSAAAFESLAADIEAGKFTSQAAMADEMDNRTKAARLAAFDQMRAAWAAKNSDTWDRAADAAKCRETAAGFRRAVAK